MVNLCFAKVCGISMNFTTHLLTLKGISQPLKDLIGIDSFYRDLDPAFHHLPPQKDEATMEQMATAAAATLEQWHCQNCDLSQCLAAITFNLWPCRRRTRIEKLRFRPTTFLGCPIRQTQLCEFARSSCQCHCDPLCAVYACTCIRCTTYYQIFNICKQTDTYRHVHVNRHLRFSPLLAATSVTTCDVM